MGEDEGDAPVGSVLGLGGRIEIWRIENGLIVEHFGGAREYDRFREQLG